MRPVQGANFENALTAPLALLWPLRLLGVGGSAAVLRRGLPSLPPQLLLLQLLVLLLLLLPQQASVPPLPQQLHS